MKIAFIAPRYHTNQTSLVRYLVESNHKVSFYVLTIGQNEDHTSLKPILINLSNAIKFIKLLIKANNPLFDYRYGLPSISELLRFKSSKYDLIIIRDPMNLISLSYILWAKIIGVRVILYIQREVHQKGSFNIKEIIEKFFIKIFNTQCISPCLGNVKFKKTNNKINYLPFCLHANYYTKKWFLNDKINILTIGKFIGRKNHLLLIRALSKIKINNNFRLTIIGECSTSEHFKNLEKIRREIEISGLDIEILINLNPNNVKDMYKSHDLFVLPSVNEPASVSNLEAMAYGLPVITTDSNNTSCYTQHEYNGYIIKSNDIESLQEKIEFFLSHKSTLIQFGNNSLVLVKNKYNPDINYKNYFEHTINY